jgi:hypothetical protein
MTIFEFEVQIPLTKPYIKFEFNVLYRWGDNERKLKISYYFQGERTLLCQKSSNHDQIQTRPVHFFDVSIS